MPSAPLPAPIRTLAATLSPRFGTILAGLAALVARAFLRDPRHVALIVPLWTRLTRASARFQRLMHRLAAGRRSPRPRLSRPGRGSGPPAPYLPTTPGWLVAALRHEAAAYAAQLESLLAEPGLPDLLAAAPAATRILRPLCRMLGLTPPAPASRPPGPAEPVPPVSTRAPARPRPPAPPPTASSDPLAFLRLGPPPRENPA